MVHVIALITAQPGQRGPLLQAFQANLAALQAHAVAPHMQAFAAQTKHLMASVLLHVLEPVAPV